MEWVFLRVPEQAVPVPEKSELLFLFFFFLLDHYSVRAPRVCVVDFCEVPNLLKVNL